MAIREVRKKGDECLRKECKPVKELTDRMHELIDDMFDTMYEAQGVGLAAPQVGILRQIVVMDCGMEEPEPIVMINPEITDLQGSERGYEGCLSLPGYQGIVTRAASCTVRFLNEDMEEVELTAEGLLSRCIQHECDHLHGVLYSDKVEGELEKLDEESSDEEA